MSGLETAKANFTSLSKVIRRLLEKELASFQGFSAQFDLYEDADGLVRTMQDRLASIAADLDAGATGPAAARLAEVAALLSQLDRLVVVAQLRGAADASGDLLPKLRQWVALLVPWAHDIREQIGARS